MFYDRNLGDARVKVGSERIVAASPNRRQIAANSGARKIDGFLMGFSARVPLFRRPELALPQGFCISHVCQKALMSGRDLADTFLGKIGPPPALVEQTKSTPEI